MEIRRLDFEMEQKKLDCEEREYKTALQMIHDEDENIRTEGRLLLADIRRQRDARNNVI